MQKKPRKDGKPFADNGSSLGTTTRFASASVDTHESACSLNASEAIDNTTHNNNQSIVKTAQNNTKKYNLQSIARRLNPNGRINICMRTMTSEFVDLHYNDTDKHAHYRGVMRCDKYWECPVCSSRHTSRQAQDVRKAYTEAIDVHGWHVALVTYTMSHRRWDELKDNVGIIRSARRSMRSGGWWQRFKRDYGYEGCVSALEVTWNEANGWHVHVHELMFLSSDFAKEFQSEREMRSLERKINKRMSKRWKNVCEKLGKNASIEHGIDVKLQDKYVAEYVAKEGHLPDSVTWDMALEVTKSNIKNSKESYHPFQILELCENPTVPKEIRSQFKALWHEYIEAFDGKAMFFWTDGLKDALNVEEVEDGEEETKESDTIIHIPRNTWRDVLYARKQAELLNETIYVAGDAGKINRWLKKLRADVRLQRAVDEHWKDVRREKRQSSVDYEANRAAEENAPRGTFSAKAKKLRELRGQNDD